MNATLYSTDDLLAHHPYARPHEVAGYRLHGGFDEAGTYVPPRTLHRWPAVRAWRRQLEARGWPLLDADASLLASGPYPSFAQQRLLLSHGLAAGVLRRDVTDVRVGITLNLTHFYPASDSPDWRSRSMLAEPRMRKSPVLRPDRRARSMIPRIG